MTAGLIRRAPRGACGRLFDEQGRLQPKLAELLPKGKRRMGANPHADGGILLRDLRMPDFGDYAVDVPSPGVRGTMRTKTDALARASEP